MASPRKQKTGLCPFNPRLFNKDLYKIVQPLDQTHLLQTRVCQKPKFNNEATDMRCTIYSHWATVWLCSNPIQQIYSKQRSNVYDHYHFLCPRNTKKSAGWLVCNYVLSGSCLVLEETKCFFTATGTSQLHHHNETHRGSTTEKTFTNALRMRRD